MKRLEAICDAVANYHHYTEPESEAYELRNPGLLKDPAENNAKRRFSCHRAGYASLLDRVEKYCLAHPDEGVYSLLCHFNVCMKIQQEQAIDFMSRSASSTINGSTTLAWFIETTNG